MTRNWLEHPAGMVAFVAVYCALLFGVKAFLVVPYQEPIMSTACRADELVDLSVRENRTVTEYPNTWSTYDDLVDDLLSIAEDHEDLSGAGCSWPEANGGVDVWGTRDDGETWRIHVIRPDN